MLNYAFFFLTNVQINPSNVQDVVTERNIYITELQVLSKYPFWAYRHHVGGSVYLCICWSAGCIYLLVHKSMFYCTGLFLTTPLLYTNRSSCINLSYGRPAGTPSVCVDTDVMLGRKFRVPFPV